MKTLSPPTKKEKKKFLGKSELGTVGKQKEFSCVYMNESLKPLYIGQGCEV